MLVDHLPRVRLTPLPTPLHRLDRLTAELGGAELWIKRDDLIGLGAGGNKVRKLELLLGDAAARGADSVITAGRAQSNHARQTAAAAARMGWRSILVLMGEAPEEITGNLLLDRLFGAEIRWAGSRDVAEVMREVSAEEDARGHHPYVVPYGGSNAIGAAGFAEGMAEMVEQARSLGVNFDRVVIASGSAGTQAGLVAGAHAAGFPGQLLGVAIDNPEQGLASMVKRLAAETAELLRLESLPRDGAVVIDEGHLGLGYGIMEEPVLEAIHLIARSEGLLVDPVYTGKALSGLIDLVRRRDIGTGERVLFWHTGGVPALFAEKYARDLAKLHP